MTVVISKGPRYINIACSDEDYEVIRNFVIVWGKYKGFGEVLYSEECYAATQRVRLHNGNLEPHSRSEFGGLLRNQPLPSIASEGLPPRSYNNYYYDLNVGHNLEKELRLFSRNLKQEFPQLQIVVN